MIRPPKLVAGDLVAIVATARSVDQQSMRSAAELIRRWGLEVTFGPHLFEVKDQFAGEDQSRIADLQWALNKPEVKAILCARGGYGTTRIIDEINFKTLMSQPKWICGFSDITAISCHLHKHQIESIHGTMPLLFERAGHEASRESLRKLLFGEVTRLEVTTHEFNQPGIASGALVGGNLSILVHLIGTPSELDTINKILFIEDIDEYLYHVDRMMLQLLRAGKLNGLAGLVVGQMTDMNDNKVPFGKTAYEIIRSHVESFNYPVAFGLPIGHDKPNIALPVGRTAKLMVASEGAQLSF
ncbi:MAG: S66 peptidase family protein [Cyclobacteriaceae bacterium]